MLEKKETQPLRLCCVNNESVFQVFSLVENGATMGAASNGHLLIVETLGNVIQLFNNIENIDSNINMQGASNSEFSYVKDRSNINSKGAQSNNCAFFESKNVSGTRPGMKITRNSMDIIPSYGNYSMGKQFDNSQINTDFNNPYVD